MSLLNFPHGMDVAALLGGLVASAQAQMIFNQDFDGGYTGSFSTAQYFGGAPTNYANRVLSSGGNPNGAWTETMTTTTWSDYYAGQLQFGSVSGNWDPNPADYTLSFDAYGSKAANIQLAIQSWQNSWFGGSKIIDVVVNEPLSAAYTWQSFSVNLGSLSGAVPTGASWQLNFQLNSWQWGGPGNTDTLTIDNVTLKESAVAQTLYLDFNAAGQFVKNFNIFNTANGAETDGIGVGGSRAVSVTGVNDDTYTYKARSWSFSAPGTVLVVSTYVKANNLTSGDKVQLGIATVNTNGLNGNAGTAWDSFRWIPTSALNWNIRRQYKALSAGTATTDTSYGTVTVIAGHWYRFATYYTNTGSSTIAGSCSLMDFGTDGQTPGAELITFNTCQTFTVTDVASSTAVYPAFRAFHDGGIDAFDNFRVGPLIAVPTGLTALATNAAVSVSWNPTADGTNYIVRQATVSGGPFTIIATVSGTYYVDTSVVNGTTYSYSVSALAPGGESESTATVSACPLAPPAAPGNLAAIGGDTIVNLTWAGSANASNYYVYRGMSSGGPYTAIHTNGTTTAYADNALLNGAVYYYVVSAVNVGGESPVSNEVLGHPDIAPSYLHAVSTSLAGTNDIALDWASLPGATVYHVFRSAVSGGPYSLLATVPDTFYDDTPQPDGTNWYYIVSGQLPGGESANSPEASVCTRIQAPVGLTANSVSATEIDLSWSSGGRGATVYKIERSTDGVRFAQAGATDASVTYFADTGLAAASGYFYRVWALNAFTNSQPSTVVWAPTWVYFARVNFGANSPTDFYPGYLQDNGSGFADRGNGYSYGWGYDNTANARERFSAASPDKRYDTLIHFQANSLMPSRVWYMALPNGSYRVYMVCGDPTAKDSVHRILANDTLIVNTDTRNFPGTYAWADGSGTATVTSGLLTVRADDVEGINGKICFMDLAVPPQALQIVSQPTNVSVVKWATTTLPMVVSGSGPITYCWYYNTDTLVSGQTNSTFVLNDTPMSAAGSYQLVASNVLGSVTSAVVTLTVDPAPPVILWGDGSNGPNAIPVGLTNLAAVAAGSTYCLALKGDGTLVAWGSMTNVPPGLSNVVAIAAGNNVNLALLADGTVAGFPQPASCGLSNIVAVAVGGACAALDASGQVWSYALDSPYSFDGVWVTNWNVSAPDTLSGVMAISVSDNTGYALKYDGTVMSWGWTVIQGDGQVAHDWLPAAPVPGLSNVVAIAAGGQHFLALLANGRKGTTRAARQTCRQA